MLDYEKDVEPATSPALSETASSDRDENYEFYRQNRGLEYTPDEAKKTLRKIDRRLIPLLFIIYMIQVRADCGIFSIGLVFAHANCMQYLDKNSINFASVYGLKQGTHLKGQDYSWLSMASVLLCSENNCSHHSRFHILLWLPHCPVASRPGFSKAAGRKVPRRHDDR